MSLIFVTGSQSKIAEARAVIDDLVGPPEPIDLPEIQGIDPRKIIEKKLELAVRKFGAGVIVEDTGLFFHAYSKLTSQDIIGLPGPLIKWYIEAPRMGLRGLYQFAIDSGDNGATAVTMIGYARTSTEFHYFQGRITGFIVSPQGNSGFGWDPIFQPAGYSQTFAEISAEEKRIISMRAEAFRSLDRFLRES